MTTMLAVDCVQTGVEGRERLSCSIQSPRYTR